VFRCTSLVLSPDSYISRDITRPIEFRGDDFEKEFDASTLFYDVIAFEGRARKNLIFVGPPLRNLAPEFFGGRLNGACLASRPLAYHARDRCCDVWLHDWPGGEVRLECSFGAYDIKPEASATEIYRGLRVLYTLSKNNDLAWLVDWARFHAANHGANAVLIYDNASTEYTSDDLEEALRRALPDLVVNVVDWPYKYGPGGFSPVSWWDSDFCQSGAFQDARFRFLSQAASVLNVDIDELVVSPSSASIFEAVERSGTGYIAFRGRWISSAAMFAHRGSDTRPGLRHRQFRYLEVPGPNACPPKWCVVPEKCRLEDQWRAHSVMGKDGARSYSDEFSYGHFRSISTNWKYQRHHPTAVDPMLHRLDEDLDRALVRAGL
jgi:Glycosyltransferase family 92